METKIYLVIVNQTAHYYVRCPSKIIENWQAMAVRLNYHVVYTEVKLSDLDEINHIHFC